MWPTGFALKVDCRRQNEIAALVKEAVSRDV
jgi:hypothetical protein